jgi:phospholipase C
MRAPGLLLLLTACEAAAPGPRSTLDARGAAEARAACRFGAGTLPGLSVARDAPLGSQIPVDTVVILMMENRSFDHLLSRLPAVGQPDVEVAPPDASNPSSAGTAVPRFHLDTYCFDDTNHEWSGSHAAYDDGAMDGFVRVNEGFQHGPSDGARTMGYYDESDLPYLYALASTFALADHGFASLLGPTYPNRAFALAGTAYGNTGDHIYTEQRRLLINELEAAKISWHSYFTNLPAPSLFIGTFAPYLDHTDNVEAFFDVAAAGKLEHVVWVDPDLRGLNGGGRNDFHPPGNVQVGQAFIARVVDAMVHSPQWRRSALFISFDEGGGLYDHVAPPAACPPDDIGPMTDDGKPLSGAYDRLGFRVPMIVVSPWARPHFVSHTVYDHTSLLRFIETRFGLPAFTARDANADPMMELFDFAHARLLAPPSLPTADVDPTQLADCLRRYPPPVP